jgi:cytochrome b
MTEKRLVWDLPTRLFHWLLVASMIGSYFTAEAGSPTMRWHMYLGYWTLGLVLFRILWGFVGPKHARFSSFFKPGRIGHYVRTLLNRDSAPSVGHNPLGGVFVVVMLLLVACQAISGLFISDDIIWSGPWNPAVSGDTVKRLHALHFLNFDILMWVVGVHVAAIVFYALYKRQNLVGPMLSGRKPADLVAASEAIGHSQLLKALIIALICAAVVYAVLAFAPPPVEDFY